MKPDHACHHCGGELPVPLIVNGRPRLYCSENCRKRATDDRKRASCRQCGKVLSAGSAWNGPGHGHQLCRSCEGKRRLAENEEKLVLVERMYKAGASYQEIAIALGWSPTSKPGELVRQLRQQGRIGYRKPSYAQH
jgi:hypothetical protein